MKYRQSIISWKVGKSLKYIDGRILNTFRPKLNGNHRRCPRCTGLLFKDIVDLFCLRCGWRESCYFKRDVDEGELKRLMYNSADVGLQ
jgi:hypothetical protein